MTAEIFDRGYRQYGGERTGVRGAMISLVKHSVRRSLGLGRPARFKVIPALIVLAAFVPAVVFVGVAALIPEAIGQEFLPTYPEYYGFTITTLYLFAAFIAPDLLCTDRRTSMLGVYLASPLDRRTYLLAKAAAVALLLGIVTILPPLFLMIAFVFEGMGPEGFVETLKVGGRIIVAGAMMSAILTAVSFAISATTDRSGTATAGVIVTLLGSLGVVNLVVENSDVSKNLLVLGLPQLPIELAYRIHGEVGDWRPGEVSTATIWLATLGIIGASILWTWSRYGPLLVRR